MSEATGELPRRAEYGVDGDFSVVSARWQFAIVVGVEVLLVALAVRSALVTDFIGLFAYGVLALALAVTAASYVRTTLVGKFEVWTGVFAELGFRGDERVLDLGCGRGAILLAAAKLLPRGRAVGVDVWQADQTGNSAAATERNAEVEGVRQRVELHTGDMTQLSFEGGSFDAVISNLAVHNLPSAAARRAAVDEAVRVLRPGGRVAIADLAATGHHVARLRELDMTEVRRRNLGWRMWWGPPFGSTHLVTATKSV